MDITEIFDMAREQSFVSSNDYSNATLLKYANKRYKIIQNAIINRVNEKYFYDILTADTLSGQNEYTLKNASGTVVGLKKVITANIKRKSTDTYYSKLEQSTSNISKLAIDEQKANPDQPAFVEIKDGSVFVFPAPSETIEGGLVIEGIVTLPDLTVTSVETDIFPYNTELRDYHYILSLGVRADIFSLKGTFEEKQIAEQDFNDELSKMLSDLSDRFSNDIIGDLPNGKMYK